MIKGYGQDIVGSGSLVVLDTFHERSMIELIDGFVRRAPEA